MGHNNQWGKPPYPEAPSQQWGTYGPNPQQHPQAPQQWQPGHVQQYPQAPYYPPPPMPVQQVIMIQQAPPTAQVITVKPPFNHGIHLVLDVLTCGMWIPIHIICALAH